MPAHDVTLTMDIAAADPAQALDLIRRVRLFATEMRDIGLDVEVTGYLGVKVRPAWSGDNDPRADVMVAGAPGFADARGKAQRDAARANGT